jgi:hypothetical protein
MSNAGVVSEDAEIRVSAPKACDATTMKMQAQATAFATNLEVNDGPIFATYQSDSFGRTREKTHPCTNIDGARRPAFAGTAQAPADGRSLVIAVTVQPETLCM